MGAKEYVLGVAVAVYSLGEMIGSTVFGTWMTLAIQRDPDRGPKRALATTIAVGFLGSVLYVVADAKGSPGFVVAARLLSGIWTGGKMVVEQTYIGEASAPERTTQITSEVGVFAVLGFVVGPSFGALFSPLNFHLFGNSNWRVDEYTAPGYFMAILCALMLAATFVVFDPKEGYFIHPSQKKQHQKKMKKKTLSSGDDDKSRQVQEESTVVLLLDEEEQQQQQGSRGTREHHHQHHHLNGPRERQLATYYGSSSRRESFDDDGIADDDGDLGADRGGLALLLFCFFAHFYSFAIQETITTPFVQARFGWSQRQVDYLFAGVGLLSLATSLFVAQLSKCCSDTFLLVFSLVLGLVGSLALIDEPFGAPLKAPRFFFGFVNITCAFPFGRNVALAMYSKVLGPTPQGSWMGLMFVIGALPRCFGPSWALYALELACELFPNPKPCPPGGRSCLEFAIAGGFFLLGLLLVFFCSNTLAPYDERKLLRQQPSLLASAKAKTTNRFAAAKGNKHQQRRRSSRRGSMPPTSLTPQ